MLIRVETPEGTKRVETTEDESTECLIKKIQSVFTINDLFSFKVFKDRSHSIQIPLLERKTVKEFGLKHGDFVYVVFNKNDEQMADREQPSTSSHNSSHTTDNHISESLRNSILGSNSGVTEDDVDAHLYGQTGGIERPPTADCRHGANAKCVHCTSIEPYDESYLKEHNIKHMSFHSYLKKLTNGIDRGKFAILENISCKIKPGCAGHAPWPQGICTKCQPSAITLNRQVYRHVDNVEFENPETVNNFINYWRQTGFQRVGFLYGYYSVHKDVPLGIKATVVAIYEPPQECNRDFIKLMTPDNNCKVAEFIASQLGLQRIGWIFTDLIPEDNQKGTVKYLRNMNTYFLSAQECIMAGFLQNSHPNKCRYSPDGSFGSKFVTVCVTGDGDNAIHMEGYQVSNQCMALVRDNCLLPTRDAPELAYVRESSAEQYVPDVYYKEKDMYNNEVQRLARPLPIEYLLVDVPVSSPMHPKYTFNPLEQMERFPIENRHIAGHLQDFNSLSKYLRQFGGNHFLEAMSDFHLLIYIATMDALPLKNSMEPLLEAIKKSSEELANKWAHSEQWATVEQLVLANTSGPSTSVMNSITANEANVGLSAPNGTKWSCAYCTFENDDNKNTCEMCSLPKET
ncbi:nuclear protein localization protein 4 homolog [Oppia nitens]|uniref:nuclear protein localization protein 4 homolog n=1 Tax=Oppia nitens TaxID=1686743 RepID=UPI0023D9FBEE|nr:nuclear protein localization protein 4 homolog [Oppia nitens]